MAVVLLTGCGLQDASPSQGSSITSTLTTTTSSSAPADIQQGTVEMAGALDTAAQAGYADSFGAIVMDRSQRGLSLQMTDLAQGRTLVADVRAQNPKWSAVTVALVKVPYTEKRLAAAQQAVPDTAWTKYQLVSVGYGTGRYLEVASCDPALKDSGTGRAAREKLAKTLGSQLGVRVLVTYSTPAHAG